MAILEFTIICLAAWNISSLLVQEDGPLHIFAKIRRLAGLDVGPDMHLYKAYGIGAFRDFTASLFMCVWCMSRWVAAIMLILYMVAPKIMMVPYAILAISTVVILISEHTDE